MAESRLFLGVENSATGRAWRDRLDERGAARALAIAQRHDIPELLARIIAGLVTEYRGKALIVEVSQADRACLPDHVDGVEVVVTTALGAGECRVRTARGEVESSVAARMDAIYQAMRAAVGGDAA